MQTLAKTLSFFRKTSTKKFFAFGFWKRYCLVCVKFHCFIPDRSWEKQKPSLRKRKDYKHKIVLMSGVYKHLFGSNNWFFNELYIHFLWVPLSPMQTKPKKFLILANNFSSFLYLLCESPTYSRAASRTSFVDICSFLFKFLFDKKVQLSVPFQWLRFVFG